MQSGIAEAKAEMQRMEAKLANDTEIARSLNASLVSFSFLLMICLNLTQGEARF